MTENTNFTTLDEISEMIKVISHPLRYKILNIFQEERGILRGTRGIPTREILERMGMTWKGGFKYHWKRITDSGLIIRLNQSNPGAIGWDLTEIGRKVLFFIKDLEGFNGK